MSEIVNVLNAAGGAFVTWAGHILIQSSVLIAILAVLDRVLRKRVQAVVRYWVWLLVLVKLVLPPSFSSPTGLAYWVSGKLPGSPTQVEPAAGVPSAPAPPDGTSVVSATPGAWEPDPLPGPAFEEPVLPRAAGAAAVSPPLPPNVPITWQALALLAWAVVVIVLTVLLIQRALFVRGLVAQSHEPPEEVTELLSRCGRRLGVRANLAVRLSPPSASPSVCGLRQPVILIPEEMLVRLQGNELKSVLFHELAHVKRGDLWLNLIQTLLQVVYFYHPLLWAANARIRRVREQAVDETVLAALGSEAEDYPRTLLSVSRLTFGQSTLSLRLLGVVESRGALMDRIRHMASRPFPRRAKLGLAGLTLVLAVGAVLLPMARAKSTASVQEFVHDFVLDREIPVGLVAERPGHLRLVEIASIRIETKYGNGWGATARVGWSPAMEATWRIRAELLDRQGHVLRHPLDRATTFTGQASPERGGAMRYAELDLEPMLWDGGEARRQVAKIRLSLEPAADPIVDNAASYALVMAVLEGKDQRPIPEATVITTAHYREAPSRSRVSLNASDARGECRIVVPKAGLTSAAVTVQKDGYVTMGTSWSNSSSWPLSDTPLPDLPERHVVEMVPAQTIGGVVRNQQGRPIAGVEVMAEAHLQEVGGMTYLRRNVLTDQEGRWQISGLAPDTYRLSLGFRHPEYAGDYFASRYLMGGQLAPLRTGEYAVVLDKGLTVQGVVLDAQGRPVPNAIVILAPRRHGIFHDEYMHTRTEAAGRFQFNCAADDRKDTTPDGGATGIRVEAPGYTPAMRKVVVEPNLAPLEFRLTPGRTVAVRVVDPNERPIAGAWTSINPLTENPRFMLRQEDSDAQGRFLIRNAPDHDIPLTVGKSGYVTLRDHTVPAGAQEQTVTLTPAPRVQGRVLDAETGQPIPDFEVGVVSSGGWLQGGTSHFKDGHFELQLDERSQSGVQLKVWAQGYQPVVCESMYLNGARALEFKLGKDPSFQGSALSPRRATPGESDFRLIRGVVQDPNGRPAAKVVVALRPHFGMDATTDAQGRFKLRRETMRDPDDDRKPAYIIARDREHNLAGVMEVDWTAVQDPVIRLAPAVILSGRVSERV